VQPFTAVGVKEPIAAPEMSPMSSFWEPVRVESTVVVPLPTSQGPDVAVHCPAVSRTLNVLLSAAIAPSAT